MSAGTQPVSSSSVKPGDRVVAATDIGGFLRARVRRGTGGLVVAQAPGGELEVHFDGGLRELVTPDQVTPTTAPITPNSLADSAEPPQQDAVLK